jgi:hypothetical protein
MLVAPSFFSATALGTGWDTTDRVRSVVPGEHREPVAPLAEQYDAYAGRGFGCFFLWDYLELVVRADQGTGSFGV